MSVRRSVSSVADRARRVWEWISPHAPMRPEASLSSSKPMHPLVVWWCQLLLVLAVGSLVMTLCYSAALLLVTSSPTTHPLCCVRLSWH